MKIVRFYLKYWKFDPRFEIFVHTLKYFYILKLSMQINKYLPRFSSIRNKIKTKWI